MLITGVNCSRNSLTVNVYGKGNCRPGVGGGSAGGGKGYEGEAGAEGVADRDGRCLGTRMMK